MNVKELLVKLKELEDRIFDLEIDIEFWQGYLDIYPDDDSVKDVLEEDEKELEKLLEERDRLLLKLKKIKGTKGSL